MDNIFLTKDNSGNIHVATGRFKIKDLLRAIEVWDEVVVFRSDFKLVTNDRTHKGEFVEIVKMLLYSKLPFELRVANRAGQFRRYKKEQIIYRVDPDYQSEFYCNLTLSSRALNYKVSIPDFSLKEFQYRAPWERARESDRKKSIEKAIEVKKLKLLEPEEEDLGNFESPEERAEYEEVMKQIEIEEAKQRASEEEEPGEEDSE